MQVPQLSLAERLSLANQYQMLSYLDKQNASSHAENAEILRRGYVGMYGRIFDSISEEDPEQVTDEVHDILSMFFQLDHAVKDLSEEEREQLDLARLRFQGFDGNHDPHHAQANFMVKHLNFYEELKNRNMNSHSQTSLPIYLRQVAMYNQVRRENQGALTVAELQRIAAA